MRSPYNIHRICAFLVGTVFFAAGMLKLMDPVGAGLVFTDYCKFFGLSALIPASKVLATLMALFETVLGAALVSGVFPKLTAILSSATLGVFTLLTLVLLIFNPEMDCGCFGEAIHLTHLQTFLKNILLCLLLVVAFLPARDYNRPRPGKYAAFAIAVVSALLFLHHSWTRTPAVEFSAFRPGSLLAAAAGVDAGMRLNTYFIYEKDGEEGAFELDNLPDSTWTFVRTEELAAESGRGREIPVLSLSDAEGNYCDERAALGEVMALSAYAPEKLSAEDWNRIATERQILEAEGFTPLLLVPARESVPAYLADEALTADYKTLITLNRANGGLTYIYDGEIIRKWALPYAPGPEDLQAMRTRHPEEVMMSQNSRGRLTFEAVLLYSLAMMVLL